MSRSFPVLVATILAVGAVGAEAHQLSSRPAPLWGVTKGGAHVSALAGPTLAQSDELVAKVKAALKADPDLGGQSDAVNVTEAGGVLTLEGTVPTVQIRARIAEFVMKVEGVTKLVNKLKVPKK
jgi:osmotically-inducible protein OsmY